MLIDAIEFGDTSTIWWKSAVNRGPSWAAPSCSRIHVGQLSSAVHNLPVKKGMVSIELKFNRPTLVLLSDPNISKWPSAIRRQSGTGSFFASHSIQLRNNGLSVKKVPVPLTGCALPNCTRSFSYPLRFRRTLP